jgi:cytochrome c oxidase cbb3-type subunit IV
MTELKQIGEYLATLWTVWAVLIFLGIAFWALRPKNRKRFERDARIPLDNDER